MALVKTWTFESSSNPNKAYETQLHSDGSTSCNCPGWTKRAVRTCKHTRMVEQGIADRYAMSVWNPEMEIRQKIVRRQTREAEQRLERQHAVRKQEEKESLSKLENMKPATTEAVPARKVNW